MVAVEIDIEDKIIEVNVHYGKRNKISIHIDSIGLITAKVPKDTSNEIIASAMNQQRKWIIEKLHQITEVKKIPKIREYDDKGKFFHLGKEYFLHELIYTNELDEDGLKNILKKFYTSSCKKIVAERIINYQQQLRVKPKTIEVVESVNKWGSCSSSKKITFNYRLAMAPVEVIDYVIIHELCHLIHMNHDRSFWRLVGSIVPDYKKKQEFLARQGQYMTL